MSIKKVIIVTNVPNPYRIPLFNEIHAQLLKKNIALKVVFGSENYSRRKSKLNLAECSFTYVFLNSVKYDFGNSEKTYFTYKGLLKVLESEKADCVIMSGFSIGTSKLWWRSLWKKTNYIIWSGAVKAPGRNDSLLRRIQRRLIAGSAKGFIAYGSKAKDYIMSLGIDAEKIEIGINTVDTAFFSAETKALRSVLTPDNVARLTYIGYLSTRKNVLRLLEIIHELSLERKDFVLDIIGDGDDKPNLEKFVQMNSLSEIVHFHGFKQKSELPAYLAGSAGFLFQTDFDIWGLVLNEAMAAGLACISSTQAGATVDLIKDGETGFIVDYKNKDLVKSKINWILDNPDQARLMGEKARNFIEQEASLHVSASGFVRAITRSLSL
ncbi:MAG TPA: glycosyltransferase family 4 protein [Bacteroidia bacterium]|nr:glycosyltransferase family 4 protein [Bacteroidia bacterium]HNS12523.1 glycosyltransferase family 4 protein [Bacteroidia bacterium]